MIIEQSVLSLLVQWLVRLAEERMRMSKLQRSTDTVISWFFKAVFETLGNQLVQLEDEIKADETGKMEFGRLLAQVRENGNRVYTKHIYQGGYISPLNQRVLKHKS